MSTATKGTSRRHGRFFHAHDSDRLDALEGLPLATFGQRALGYFTDVFIAILIWVPLESLWRRYLLHQSDIELRWDFHEVGNVIVLVLYWAAFHYFANGRTPGKMLARMRIVSLTGERLGYGNQLSALWDTEQPSSKAGLASCNFSGTRTGCAPRIVSPKQSSSMSGNAPQWRHSHARMNLRQS